MALDDLFPRLEQQPEYRRYLYRFGYLIADGTLPDPHGLLSHWHCTQLRGWHFYIHPDQKLYHHESAGRTWFLIGHCMNPQSMEHREEVILPQLAQQPGILFDLTGVYIVGWLTDHAIRIWPDAAGMLMADYGTIDGRAIICSHPHLASSLLGLQQSEYVRRLTSYRFYPLFGFFLPGDRTPCEQLRRLVPNHTLFFRDGSWDVRRIYPNQPAAPMTMEERAERAAEILQNTMALIPKKWDHPAITLTGGCDSKTTLACAAGVRDQYSYFSYNSQQAEAVDAEGAAVICKALGLPHSIHPIPDSMPDEELVRDIIAANMGGIGYLPMREVRKRLYLAQMEDVDVEVKSWGSEIGRAYFHKRFAKASFPAHPTPRYLTSLYKVFLHNRRLVRETDEIFREYLEKYLRPEDLQGFDWIDLFFWEFRVGGWNGLVITGEHRFAFDITIPYNNRHLLELLLGAPLEDRMADRLYTMIRSRTDPKVDAAGVAITNLKHTSRRARLERLYLAIHSRLPF